MNVNGIPYGQICGKIHAYQYASTDAFGYYKEDSPRRNPTIDDAYVDGISLTYDNPRKHIWTFAGGLDEYTHIHPQFKCPCTDTAVDNGAIPAPSFVGDDYFCETGVRNRHWDLDFHLDDPLWDGEGCENINFCCIQRRTTTPPWFRKRLSESTTADIEMRMCRDDPLAKDVPYHEDPDSKHDNSKPQGHQVKNTGSINFDEDTPFDQLAIYVR